MVATHHYDPAKTSRDQNVSEKFRAIWKVKERGACSATSLLISQTLKRVVTDTGSNQ